MCKIHQFDPVLYPIKLWVSITDKDKALSDRFYQGTDQEEFDFSMIKKHEAVTFIVQQRSEPAYFGILIVFTKKKYCTAKTMAHEATHAANWIWDRLGESPVALEADAYLVGWIVECIEKVKLNKI